MENPETIKEENQIGLNYLIRNQCPKELIEDLLNCESIQLNYQNNDGDTAMHIAVNVCRKDIVDLLIAKGGDVNIGNNLFKTPITIAEENFQLDQSQEWESIMFRLKNEARIKRESIQNEPIPSTSKAGIKRSGESLENSIIERKKRKTDKHPASGLKNTLHGIVFQLKLLMLFAHRAINNNLAPFKMATEFDPAEKFDDIVFMSENTRVLQAKHKNENEGKRITSIDLLSTLSAAPFTLHKYFISFCKIKRSNSKWFKNAEVSDFIIITNADFDLAEYRPTKIRNNIELRDILQVESDLNRDKILFIDAKKFNAKKFKLNSNGDLKGLMKINLLNTALKTKIQVGNIKAIKDLLFAMKTVHFETYIISVKEAVEKLNDRSAIRKIKSETKMVLQLQETVYDFSEKCKDIQFQKMVTNSDNSLEQYSLLKNRLKDLRGNNRTTLVSEIKTLASSITSTAMKDLAYSKRLLNDYNSAESKEVVTLETVESELKDIKKQISESETFDSIQQQIENKFLKMNVTRTFFSDLTQKFDDFEDVKQEIEKKLDDIISEVSFIRLVLTCNEELDSLFKEFFDKFHFVTNYPNERDLGEYIDKEFSTILNLLNYDFPAASFERYMLTFLKTYKNKQAEFLTSDHLIDFFEEMRGRLDGMVASGIHQQHIDILRKYGIRFKINPRQLEEFIDHSNSKQIFHFCTTTPRLTAIKVLHTVEASTQYHKCDSYIFSSLKTLLTGDDAPTERGKDSQEIILNAFKMKSSHCLLVIEIHDEADGDKADRIDLKRLCDSLSEILANNLSKKLVLIGKKGTNFWNLDVQDQLEELIYFRDLDEASQMRVLDKEVNFQEINLKLNELINEKSADLVFNQEILSEFLEDSTIMKIGDKRTFESVHYKKDYYIERQFQLKDGTIRDEKDFCTMESLTQKTVVIANEAGMGKSTVLTSIANKIRDSLRHVWIVRINLNDFKADKRKSRSISKISFGENDTDNAIEFMLKMISLNVRKKLVAPFQNNLFKLALEDTNTESRKPKIVIIFDGFDEVSRSINETTALIKALNRSQVSQIWISTRIIKKHHLEEAFQTSAYILIPLSNENQIQFSSNLWKRTMKYRDSDKGTASPKRFYKDIITYLNDIQLPDEDYATQLKHSILGIKQKFPLEKRAKIKVLMSAIDALDFTEYIKKLKEYFTAVEGEGDDFGFTTNPLHLKMLTEVIYEKKFKLEKNLGLLDLYDEFVKIKFKIYYKMKAVAGDYEAMEDANDRDLENVCKIHCALSVKMLTDDATCKSLPNLHLYEGTKEQNQQLDKIGFFKLVDEHKTELKELEYVHRSYAEYFCSRYLIDNRENQRVQELCQVLVIDDNKMLQHFFEKSTIKRELMEKRLSDIEH